MDQNGRRSNLLVQVDIVEVVVQIDGQLGDEIDDRLGLTGHGPIGPLFVVVVVHEELLALLTNTNREIVR